ncbi:glycosyltransferase family 2 protein [Marivita sp. S6314]|uniref:glycosyltransferase family 2 protein n=1 Tax=Marivita sp. S6314 TaxID=2926406 RepID=UPI001FF5D3E5|nr:glycosyltransferase family 2 protein [Marivita sp. S6314]MCK0150740.1 glycosyltransferase family 2 protein [Marivita sp. S6314]
MRYAGINDLLSQNPKALATGPIALVFAEDAVEIDTTLRHNLQLGFKAVIVFMMPDFELAPDVEERVLRVDANVARDDNREAIVNAVIAKAPGIWMYVCYNAEFLFFPFCETRTIGELLAFHTEERRDAMLCYAVDIYAGDLERNPDAVNIEDAYLDRSGYYALGRPDPVTTHPRERQLDFFGGLRWRYEEHVPPERRKIDRIALFRAKPGLELQKDHTFNDQEYNTYACPWHNNLTACVVSFRTAKALKRNPGSAFEIETFRWHNSVPFEWHSRQLLDLGLMETGQWF